MRRRTIALFTGLAMFGNVSFLYGAIPVAIEAKAANTNYYASYIKGLIGTPSKEWGDAGEGTQCVELVKYYIEQLWNVPTYEMALGNGNAMYSIVAQKFPQYFTSIAYYDGMTLIPGDIISYNSDGWAADYGHAALVYEVNGNSYKIAEQWQGSETVRTNSKTIRAGVYGEPYTIIGVARPKDDESPILENAYISDMDESGYTVNCTVKDDSGIDRVEFPTWTTENGQDDIIWGKGSPNGNVYSYRVNTKDHSNERGDYLTHIYAYDFGGNSTSCSVGVTVPQNDSQEPVISDISIIDMHSDGFTVKCTVTDNTYISRVLFPTWTTDNGQDDLIWGWGERDGNTFTYRVNASDHNGEMDNFLTHIYAYDYANNVVSVSAGVTSIERDITPPEIKEAFISDLSDTGYTVNCTVSDPSGVERVAFPTWTTENGQDDIIWGEGARNGGFFSYRVEIGDHLNEKGDYLTHIYAYDSLGNTSSISVGVTRPLIDTEEPAISDIRIVDVDENGYTVQCKVTDNTNISRVVFPTWTLKEDSNGNNQDDLIWGWGVSDGDTYSYRVNVSDHHGEKENYLTHIYAYDYSNNVVAVSCGVVENLTDYHIEGDCNADGEFNISDIVVFQNWLLGRTTELENWKAADLCEDSKLDVFDLCLMRRKLIYG